MSTDARRWPQRGNHGKRAAGRQGQQVTSAGGGVTEVPSSRAINTVFPLAGGGDLSADRTHSVSTAGFLVTSARAINTLFPLSGGANLSVDRTFVIDTAFLVNTARSLSVLYPVSGGGNLGADRVFGFSSGATTGLMLITSNGTPDNNFAWVGTGGGSGAPTDSPYITYAPDGTLSAERILIGGTNMMVSSDATNFFVSASGKTVSIPLALLTVQPDTANAFWTATNNATIDEGFVRYVDAGEGISTWYGIVPENLAAVPQWRVAYYCKSNTVAVSTAMVTMQARLIPHAGQIDGAYTMLSSANALSLLIGGTMNIVQSSGGNYDTPLALTRTSMLLVMINRHGGSASDTLTSAWDLYGTTMRVNVL